MMGIQQRLALLHAARQQQFLEVIDCDEAHARFRRHLTLTPLGEEIVPLQDGLRRVLARDVVAGIDVPGFDRSRVDGFALRAADTVGASDDSPHLLHLNPEILTPGIVPNAEVAEGTATIIATGGMMPRGADAVIMVEYTEAQAEHDDLQIEVRRPVAPRNCVAAAAGDIAQGETLLRAGQVLTSREIGCLAAIGQAEVAVWRKPRVAIFSTGDELVTPGQPIRTGYIFDSNTAILSAAVEELGGIPVPLGIARDNKAELVALLEQALESDVVLLSGGTSKGAGDLAYHVVGSLTNPGIVVHGAALKPGKPICLAVTNGKPVVILPGFPTSAIFTFHEFVAPVIRALAGLPPEQRETVTANLATRVNSERGRTEFVMASLIRRNDGTLAAYPTTKGSGAVTAFGQADGFLTIGSQAEMVPAGTRVDVTLIGGQHKLADLVIIGSHCVGLDLLIGRLMREGISIKSLNVGSTGGLIAAKRGECDLAPIHLMDSATGNYNRPFLTEALDLVPGYGRLQGIVFRPGDSRFEGLSAIQAAAKALTSPECLMINRNTGSGTRILMDQLLEGAHPAGYANQAKTHNAVAVAIAQGRADWGIAIRTVARMYGLGFLPLQSEQYDFAVPRDRLQRAPVQRFLELLRDPSISAQLTNLGFEVQSQ
jgi:putative molybdopterin biosynthesis protein